MLIHGRFSLPLARASAFTIRRATIPLASGIAEASATMDVAEQIDCFGVMARAGN
jgi:hypothetical protein